MTRKLTIAAQAIVAGAVAALMILGAQSLVSQAQDAPPEPPPEEPAAEEPPASPEDVSGANIMSGVDPCTLLTAAEAQAFLGADVTVQEHSGQCAYVAMDLSGRAISVSAPKPVFAQEGLDTVMGHLAQALEGESRVLQAGDEAAGMFSDHVSQVAIREGEDRIVLLVSLIPDGTVDAQAASLTDLAITALSRR